ncbi:MAG TPA: cytochrome C, partial [Polaromonas sp.]|nr:cytochrome C [Polaromonas sp.]
MVLSRSLLAILSASLFFGHNVQAAEPAPATANIAVPAPRSSDKESALIERGKYVAQLGDCVACHTANKVPAMAGGREFKTPFGTVYSTNITPDAQTGIGKYSF